MKKFFKYLVYVFACVAVILLLIKHFGETPKQVKAYELEKTVNVYFGNKEMGDNKDCSEVFAVQRKIINAETLGPGALQALIDGVNTQESDQGYFSDMSSSTLVQKFEIKDGVAYVDLNQLSNKSDSCIVQTIKTQIEKTLTDQSDIKSVVISVDGK